MNVRVHGCESETFELELIHASYFFGVTLLSRQMLRNIHVDIFMKKRLKDHGNCSISFFTDSGKPRYFEIQLKYFKKTEKIISTLAHEFVHLKQFATYKLNDSMNNWDGCDIDTETTSYHDLPWEVEAACLEMVLLEQYKRYKYYVRSDQETS